MNIFNLEIIEIKLLYIIDVKEIKLKMIILFMLFNDLMIYIINIFVLIIVFDLNLMVCSVFFINDSLVIVLRDLIVNELLKVLLMKIIDFNLFMNIYNLFINVLYVFKEGELKIIDKVVYEIKVLMMKLNLLIFDGDSFVNDIILGKIILMKEYLKFYVSEFVEIEKEGGIKFDLLNFIFSLVNVGVSFVEWIII